MPAPHSQSDNLQAADLELADLKSADPKSPDRKSPNPRSPDPKSPDPGSPDRWIAVARLLRPQGRRGELLADPLTDVPEIFVPGRQFRMSATSDTASTATLEDSWRPQGRNAGRLVLKLSGVDSITAAETLHSRELFVPEDAFPALDSDTYLVRDLVGCGLYDGDTLLGTVSDLQFPIAADGRTRLPDAADLLVIEQHGSAPDAEPVLVPFVKAWLDTVDTVSRRIVMHLPPGLFDLPEADPTGDAPAEP